MGLGDSVVPAPVDIVIPGIISTAPEATIKGYPVETAIAEKFHAMVELGLQNSRMKDYFDVAVISQTMSVDPATLRAAFEATFRRRGTELPTSDPVSLQKELRESAQISARWRAFVKKNSIQSPFDDLEHVQTCIRSLVAPALSLETEDERC